MHRICCSATLFALISLAPILFSSSLEAQTEDPTRTKNVAEAKPAKPNQDAPAEQEKTDSTADKPVEKTKQPESVAIETKPILVYEAFEGVFESTRMHEVKSEFENWTDLKIETVIEEGSAVTAGQELIKFDTMSIDKALKEAEFAVRNSEFDLETARLNAKEISATFELDQALADRIWQNAQQDYEYYKSVLLPQRMDDLDYREKTAGYYLEYSRDELDQLEQMYTEDDLTEESEEIVLKRARRSVESAERSQKDSERSIKRDRETNIEREKIGQKDAVQRQELAFQRSAITLPIAKQKTENALAQAEFEFANKVKHLEDLRDDRKKMTIVAPADGIVYYGSCERGKWIGGPGAPKRQLEQGTKVATGAVLMTVVDAGQMMVRSSMDESQLDSLAPRMRGKALIKSTTNRTVPATIKSVSRIPLEDGKFDCQIMVEQLPDDAAVMPGMGCKLSFLVHENKQAIVAPKASVFSDDAGVTHYVFILDGEKTLRKTVLVGHTSGEQIEIIDGLAAGDLITKAKP